MRINPRVILLVLALMLPLSAYPCTNFIVTKGASTDGSVMVTYAADSHVLYGELYHFPAKKYKASQLAMRKIVDWDSGEYLGEIPEALETYSVIGNMNEYQLIIGETTFGGRPELEDSTSLIDYGSLIYITLQRAKTAREAIAVMAALTEQYGFRSGGESFSIADKNEAWIMEMVGKGSGGKGALWVARKIPDGYICAHANQARITTFPLNDAENCLYSKDVISFAREKGWFSGRDEDFSFSDTYCPVDFHGARFCELRVWSFFKDFATGMEKYFDYAQGHNLSERMPLWVKPDKKVSPKAMMDSMRDHLEGTPLDMRKDPGAGPFGLPYRSRPLTYKIDGKEYCNERATATQQTAFWFVGQARSWLPDVIGGVLWFGVDDAATSVLTPMYCGITQVAPFFAEGNGSMTEYSETSAFWLVNQVANFAYLRYDAMGADVRKMVDELEESYLGIMSEADREALEKYKKSPKKARKFLTEYTAGLASLTFISYQEIMNYLLVKYIDFNIKQEKDGTFMKNKAGNTCASPLQPGYPEWFLREIVKGTGTKLEVKH